MNPNPFSVMQSWLEEVITTAANKVVEELKRDNSIELLTAAEVAEALKIDLKAVYKLDLARVKPYGEGSQAIRFSKSEVLAYLKNNTTNAAVVQIGRQPASSFWDKRRKAA